MIQLLSQAAMSLGSGSAYQLLEYLYERPIITVNGVTTVTGLSYQNANRLVTRFQECGLLHQMDTHQRNRRFIYADYLAMFDKEAARNSQEIQPEYLGEDTTQSLK
jgi:DNA-binding MarR family transcriptional regulator